MDNKTFRNTVLLFAAISALKAALFSDAPVYAIALAMALGIAVCAFFCNGRERLYRAALFAVSCFAIVLAVAYCMPESAIYKPYFKVESLILLLDTPFSLCFAITGKTIPELKKNLYRISALVLCFAIAAGGVGVGAFRSFGNKETAPVFSSSTGLYAADGFYKSEYSGVAENKNAVVIAVPDLLLAMTTAQADGAELTPNINAFLQESLSFSQFHADSGEDSAFTAMNSLYPLEGGVTPYAESTYYGLPSVLAENGYESSFFSTSSPLLQNAEPNALSWGFDSYVSSETDAESLTTASEFLRSGSRRFAYVDITSRGGETLGEIVDNVKNADAFFGEFLDSLGAARTRTAIVLYGYPTSLTVANGKLLSSLDALIGRTVNCLDGSRSVFALSLPHIRSSAMSNICSAVEIFPAVADVLGLEYKDLLIYGSNPLCGSDGKVLLRDYCADGSFIDAKHVYFRMDNGNDQIFNTSDMTYSRLSDCVADFKANAEILAESDGVILSGCLALQAGERADVLAEKSFESLKLPESIRSQSLLPWYDLTVRTLLLGADTFGEYTKGVYLSADGWTPYPGNALGRCMSGKIEISEASYIEPFAGQGCEVYISIGNENGYTEYFDLSEDIETDDFSIANGRITSKNEKITAVRLTVDIPQGASLSTLSLYSDALPHAKYGSLVNALLDIGSSDTLDGAVRKILGYYENDVPTDAISTPDDALIALANGGCYAFRDIYPLAALNRALGCGAAVLCEGNNGEWFTAAGYADGEYIVFSDGKKQSIARKELLDMWNNNVIVAADKTPDLVIIEDFIPLSAIIRPGYVAEEKKYIVIHNTGNYDEGSDAAAHAAYLRSQAAMSEPREASWHYTVDENVAYYHIPDNENAWHASDGSFGQGNYYGIGIEICVNGFPGVYEGAAYEQWLVRFKKTLDNAARLTAKLMEKYSLGTDAIMQHYDFAPDKKNCPMQMRYQSSTGTFSRDEGDMWLYFLDRVSQYSSK